MVLGVRPARAVADVDTESARLSVPILAHLNKTKRFRQIFQQETNKLVVDTERELGVPTRWHCCCSTQNAQGLTLDASNHQPSEPEGASKAIDHDRLRRNSRINQRPQARSYS